MIDSLTLEVPSLLTHWGLTARQWQKIKDVYLVETDFGNKNLKISPLNKDRLAFVHQAVKHLHNQGFSKMVPLIPTTEGNTYIIYGNHALSLFDWIEGRQCDFKNQQELAESTKILADFHRKSAGFDPPAGSNMRDQLGKCLQHFEERYRDLHYFKKDALSLPKDNFAQLYLKHVDFFLPMALKAIDKLRKSNYQFLVHQGKISRTFCHGDPAARNFILTPENKIFMIDFDSCRLDLPIMDLIKFIRRVMKKYNWHYQTAKFMIDSYQEIVSLSPAEIDVLRAVFYFPQKFWRISIRHFHTHQRHSLERELHKFQKYLSSRHALARFQVEFENYPF